MALLTIYPEQVKLFLGSMRYVTWVFILLHHVNSSALFLMLKGLFVEHAINALFGKIGPHPNADVIIHLIIFKCMPLLLYGTESCLLTKADVQSVDFTVTRLFFLIKIFNRVIAIW
jgi:hypothetical protein